MAEPDHLHQPGPTDGLDAKRRPDSDPHVGSGSGALATRLVLWVHSHLNTNSFVRFPEAWKSCSSARACRFELSGWELIPESDNRGETFEATRGPLSEFSRTINRLNPEPVDDHAVGLS